MAQSKLKSIDVSIKKHLIQSKKTENLVVYQEALTKIELMKRETVVRDKNFKSLVKLVDLEKLPSRVEFRLDFYLLLSRYRRIIKKPLITYLFTWLYLLDNPLNYSLTCMKRIYTLYNERGFDFDECYLVRMSTLVDAFNKKMIANRKEYKNLSTNSIYFLLEQDFYDMKECFDLFFQEVQADCKNIREKILQ
ncbi:MAG TPA: hypothetical protein DCL21_00645 [Alphaproteobacteria bacterium]|nr:hypothetical protein [Alphaproteobacteria bacterium]